MFILKIIFLIVFVQISGSELFAQKIIDSIMVCELPVREGVIYEYNPKLWGCIHPIEQGASIITKCDSIFHFGEGKIVAVSNFGSDGENEYGIIIRNEKDEFISYSNLKYVSLKKGDIVKKGAWLGFAGKSEDGKDKQVDFMLFKKDKKLPFKKEVEYIRCTISCEPQKAYTL